MPGQSIGPFRVLRKLGAGGMGDVYLAEDTRLDRKVALKSPTESWLRSPDARVRLHREARAAARLNHPAIAAIYDILDIDGRPYIVIEYVEGEPLSAIVRQGPMPVERALGIARQLAEALEVAHAAGVIHRDLKPANVMLTPAGGVKVLDFGLARTNEPREGEPRVTEAGQLLGTPDYMAPEQFVGRPADERTDVYSLGAVLYELVTGVRPFAAADPLGRVLGTLAAPPPASARNPRLPADLDALLSKALALEPRDRFQSAAELKHELDRLTEMMSGARTRTVSGSRPVHRGPLLRTWALAAAGVLLVAVAAGLPFVKRWREAPSVRSDVPVVAVIPLRNDTGDPANDFLGRAFSDSLVTGLAAVRSLAVVARVPADDLQKAGGEPRRIAKAIGATYLIDGSFQKSGERLKVNVRLVQAENAVEWARDFEETTQNIFELQRRIAVGVSEGLRVALSPLDRQRLETPPTANIAALRAYSEGRAWLDQQSRAGASDNAIAQFRDAIERDPKFALAYAGLGDALWLRYNLLKQPRDATEAIQAIEFARSLDPENPLIRLSLARSYYETGRVDEALTELRSVLSLQPNNDDAHRWLGRIHARGGDTEKAIAAYQQAISIRPDYWRNHSSLGALYYNSGRFADAAIAYQRVTELQPDNADGFMNLGAALHAAGDIPRAIDKYKRSIDISPTDAAYSNLGVLYHSQRRYDEAIGAFEAAIRLAPAVPMWHRNLGDAHRLKGNAAGATAGYERAIELATRTLSVNPKDADTLSLIALCEAKLGRFAAARKRIGAAVESAPDSGTVLFRAASVEALAGEPRDALALLERAIDKGFSRTFARESDDFAALAKDERFVRLTTR